MRGTEKLRERNKKENRRKKRDRGDRKDTGKKLKTQQTKLLLISVPKVRNFHNQSWRERLKKRHNDNGYVRNKESKKGAP